MPVNDVSDVLHYLHSFLEGRNEQHVNRWLEQNKEVLKTLFSGPEMARLKFTPIEFARKLLAKHSVAFEENIARTRRETFLLGYADECLDAAGELRADHYGRIFDGLLRDFLAGDEPAGRQRVLRFLQTHQAKDAPLLAEPVQDLLYFAESELPYHPEWSGAIVLAMKAYFDGQQNSMQEVERVLALLS